MPFRYLFVATLALLSAFTAGDLSAQYSDSALRIRGYDEVKEQFETRFMAVVGDRPIREDIEAYTPLVNGVDGRPILAMWLSPLLFAWDFGDGHSVTILERTTVSHFYEDDGTYTVTVTASDHEGTFATATHQITVKNRDPFNATVSSVEIDPATVTVELTASAQDARGDRLTYEWDFGDGDTAAGEDLWWTRHQYASPGVYEAQVTFTDEDGGKQVEKEKVRVRGGDGGPERTDLDDPSTSEVVVTGFNATVAGVVSADLVAEMRSLRGLYLSAVDPGVCRFVFSAWDDSNLAVLQALTDLRGVPPEGATYTITKPNFLLIFYATAEDYRLVKSSSLGRAGGLGLGGLDPQSRTPTDTGPMPETSPLGIDQSYPFSASAGELKLTFVPGYKASGSFDLTLQMAEHGPVPYGAVRFDGSFDLDLAAAQHDGMLIYRGCEPAPLTVTHVWPLDGTEHLYTDQPSVAVRFSERIDPATVTGETLQVGYRDPEGHFVPAAGRILRDDKGATFVAEGPLRPGVRYTGRVRTGDQGVRGRTGSPLTAEDGGEWYAWHFATRVDMVPETDGKQLLACHLYQTARDVPMIEGKPAIARIFANWEAPEGVNPQDQVQDFVARVVLRGGAAGDREIASQLHEFVRPDLWRARGLDQRRARHTAQVTGIVPEPWMDGVITVTLEIPMLPGTEPTPAYRTWCLMSLWDRRPKLSIDFVALPIADWLEDPLLFAEMQAVLQKIADEAVEYAWQLFPFAEITGSPVRILEPKLRVCRCPPFVDGEVPGEGLSPKSGCDAEVCKSYPIGVMRMRLDLPEGPDPEVFVDPKASGIEIMTPAGPWPGMTGWLQQHSTADIVVAFGPHELLGGAVTKGTLFLDPWRGAVLTGANLESENFSRYVEGLVHEIGHVLELQHLPYFDNINGVANREIVVALRDGSPSFQYKGIEGLRMSRDGASWWNKSSWEGNEESAEFYPLMFPGTVPRTEAFIANHNYRKIQHLLEDLDR